MILVAGIADEGPVARVVSALAEIGANYRLFDQRDAASVHLTVEIADACGGGAVGGALQLPHETIPLPTITAMYLRLMDDELLPDAATLAPDSAVRAHCRRLHELMLGFADLAPGRVLNRPTATLSNTSKPYQAQIIRAAGFDIPETVITNDPVVAREFIDRAWANELGVIYKSASGIRSIVQRVDEADLARLERIRWCPTQFQRQVAGTDVRVHVVGETAIAVSIDSDATDYRYAARQTGTTPAISRSELDASVRRRCIHLARALDLPLAGIDLRRTPEGRYVCFEVNPSPAFTFYEERAGVPIAMAIARYLAGEAH
jgi:glutathione synthase/RimK-type ligase-like ATP-grasp enzyme